jgi:ABC-type Na+ efflux pump permease subunit
MSRVVTIALREVRSYLQDRGDLAFSLFLPIATFALMYGAFAGQTLFNGTAYIVNDDSGGVYSELLVHRLDDRADLAVALLTRDEAEAKLSRSDVLLFAYIPPDFSDRLSSGWPTEITFRQRGNGGQEGQIVASIIRTEADAISQEVQVERQVLNALGGKAVTREQAETTVQGQLERERESPIVRVEEVIVGAETSLVHQSLPGIVAMFVLFAVTMSSRTIVEERRKGTLERLLTTRLSGTELYLGKFFAGTSRGFVQTSILLGLSWVVFNLFTPLSFLMALVVAVVFSAAASSIGMVIASVARTDDQAAWISVFVTMSTVMLGGTFFDIRPGTTLALLGKASINTYAISAFRAMTVPGVTLGDVGFELAVLVGVMAGGLFISRLLFRAVPGGG